MERTLARAPDLRGSHVLWLTALTIGLLLLPVTPAAADKAAEADLAAIEGQIRGFVAVFNDPGNAKLSREDRARRLAKFYRPESSFAGDQPLFFGPLSSPVVRGAEAHVDNVTANYALYQEAGRGYKIRVDEMQISLEGSLAVVAALTTGVIVGGQGEPIGSPGRWTVVLEKSPHGEWLITHEHVSFYNQGGGPGLTLEQLERRLAEKRRSR